MRTFFKRLIVFVLTLEARLVLWKYKPRIVAITGSVGKTSTKDAIATVLSTAFFVRKSHKSYNSEFGVPLTILGCETGWRNPFLWLKNIVKGLEVLLLPNHYPQWLVLEVGLDRPGDIAHIVRWLRADVVVYTRFAPVPVHVEFFESPEALLDEKRLLATALRPNGVLVVNADDEDMRSLREQKKTSTYSYGFGNRARIHASDDEVVYHQNTPIGVHFRVDTGGSSLPVTLHGVLGRQHIYPTLAALTVAVSQDLNLVDAIHALSHQTFAPGRMRILEGIADSMIIDDSYNASPVATKAALHVLRGLKVKGKKLCVLGDMTELGQFTREEHEQIGHHAAESCDMFVAVGQRMKKAIAAAETDGMAASCINAFTSSEAAEEYVHDMLRQGDVVLVKGSQVIRMERIVERLLRHPEQKRQLLVRQGRAWMKR